MRWQTGGSTMMYIIPNQLRFSVKEIDDYLKTRADADSYMIPIEDLNRLLKCIVITKESFDYQNNHSIISHKLES